MKAFLTAKTFKAYNKCLRKYTKKYEWWYDKSGKIHNPQFRTKLVNLWLSYKITTVEEAQEALSHPKYMTVNLKQILNEFIEDYHKEARIDKDYGILYGVELTNEDYYWIIQLPDGNFQYESCVGKYKLKENE